MYLGKNLEPKAFYKEHSNQYINPHATGIIEILNMFVDDLNGTILDLGCGDGLATKTLSARYSGSFVGVDAEAKMVQRYITETGFQAYESNFWDPLPKSDFAIACYALHLCPESYLYLVAHRLIEASVQSVLIVSPLKRPESLPGFTVTRRINPPVGPRGKRIFGTLFKQRN